MNALAPNAAAVLVDGLELVAQSDTEVTPLVGRIDFEVAPGEAVGIIGESGSGKSLLIRSVSGLLPHGVHRVSGSIEVTGSDITRMTERELRNVRGRRVGMVFQDSIGSLDPLFSVGQQMIEAIRVHRSVSRGQAREEALALLNEVGITDAEERLSAYPHELSGGMAQRVAIAIALSNSPDVLIADEATTALDVTVQKQVIDLLRNIRDSRGCAIVFVSHDLATVSTLVDRVCVMRQGVIVEQGTTRAVLHDPQHPYTQELLNSRPQLGGEGRASAPTTSLDETAEAAKPVLRVDHLSKQFRLSRRKSVHALKDVSLEVHGGEWLGVVGESGSGKSTLARIVAQLEEATSGTVSFRGTPTSKLTGGRLGFARRMQYMYQNSMSAMNPRLTAAEIVAEPLRLHRICSSRADAIARARELLEEVGLAPAIADRRPGQLSGGQCQRIALARALALEPEVLLLDEPTSALDVSAQAQIIALLQKIESTRDLTVVMISHDLALVSQTCHRVAVLYHGDLVEVGDTAEVVRNPQHEYTRKLLDAVPRID